MNIRGEQQETDWENVYAQKRPKLEQDETYLKYSKQKGEKFCFEEKTIKPEKTFTDKHIRNFMQVKGQNRTFVNLGDSLGIYKI